MHVTDFGIAKFSSNNNINETSGTPGYMAPEVMRGLEHTGSVDYFAVGIIAYELMMGKRPYLGKTRKEIREQMMTKQIFLNEQNIPIGWSNYAADFINRLLIRKDSSRLGFYNDLEVKRHPWLRSINFAHLINYKIDSPFLPRKNHDNYDKKYCQEIEEIGIDTNLRYEEYRNNEKYTEIFEGFTFYNVDESKLIQYNNEIYKKPSVKYMNHNINLNNTNNNNDYFVRKSRTINLDYDYKNKIIQTPKQNRNITPSRQNNNNISPIKNPNKNLSSYRNRSNINNISPIRNQNISSYRNRSNINNISPIRNQNISSYRNRSNISNRTINYSNVENNLSKQSSKINIKYNQNNSLININPRLPLKNGEDLYIMASPAKRGRITINSNDNNIDNSFRQYANHSFVETNYSKGKIFRRSYSSTNLHNSNYINIFNLLVNNVNNNNTIKNNDTTYARDIYRNNPKLLTPISYNKINQGGIPYDRRPNSCYKNYNSFNLNNNNNNYHHHHNRSYIEKPKNYSFYFVDNDNIYNYSNICNNYNNYNNYDYKNNTFRYSNKNLNRIFNECYEEESKNYSNQKEREIERDKYKELKNINYSYQLKEKIPIGNITKIIPVKIQDRSLPNNNTINIDYSNRKYSNINYNKIQSINNIRNIPNNFLYIDKYEKKDFIKEENKNNENPKEIRKIFSYKMNDKNNLINIVDNNMNNHSLFDEKNINKRNSQIIKNNSYGNININSMNNNLNNSNRKNNRTINNSNKKNKKGKNKNSLFKKIPLPIPLNKTLKTKKVEILENNDNNKKISISKINIINNNIINNNLINNNPINYNNKCNNNNSYLINENNKNNSINKLKDKAEINNDKINDNINYNQMGISFNNRQNNLGNSKIINKNNDIISMRINEKTFCQYKYLENFDKYKKIKNINDRNKNKYINKEPNKSNNKEIRKKKLKINNDIIINKQRIK